MKTVITYGTFDLFHQGHYNIIERAKAQGDFLIVGVTSESYDLERGKLNVQDDLITRINNVKKTGFADKIILEEYQGQKINDIIKYSVNTLVIGSDWRGKFDYLKEFCAVIYLERTRNISSTMIRAAEKRLFKIGFATDDECDNSITQEALFVSGAHVDRAYCPSKDKQQQLRCDYQLNSTTHDFSIFLDGLDIVYIKTNLESRAGLVRRSIAAGKHVIAETPLSSDDSTAAALFEEASRAGVVLVEGIKLAYLRAFTQLTWLLHGGAIGTVMKLQLSCKLPQNSNLEACRDEALAYSVFATHKLLNITQPVKIKRFCSATKEGDRSETIFLDGENKFASIELSNSRFFEDRLTIFGTSGVIRVPGDWRNLGYFKVETLEHSTPKRYSFNFEGNGFRYLLQELLMMIEEDRIASPRLSVEDALATTRTLQRIATQC